MKEPRYPCLEIDIGKLEHNIDAVVEKCEKIGIEVAGVVKGFNAIPEIVKVYDRSDCKYLASSRIEQIIEAKQIGCKKPCMLIRICMESELEDVVKYCEYSLNSETIILDKLNDECTKQNKFHKVILMADLGDLREGWWDKEEMIKAAVHVEKDLPNIYLSGIGTNLGCYGSILATPEKMNELIKIAEKIENQIGRRLDIISGGGSTSTPLVFNGSMPKRINHLRIGEGIMLPNFYDIYKVNADFLERSVFTLKVEIIEVKDKPSHPVGQLAFDAFGKVQTYTDRGIRRRALAAIGKVDLGGDVDSLIPKNQKVEILGASSDHLILDIEQCKNDIHIGDSLVFDICYSILIFLTSSKNVHIVCKD